jgi:low temperature requirement protein LtrA
MSHVAHRLKSRFWQPPRAHGEVIDDRTVSPLELFYDLIFVVVISRATHTLAEHVSVGTTLDFIAVFGTIWFAWMNGTMYLEFHGRGDGRTRTVVFVEMAMLAVVAVFTADAANSNGRTFALVVAGYLAFVALQWAAVRRYDSEEFLGVSGRYVLALSVTVVVMAASAFVEPPWRRTIWLGVDVVWITLMFIQDRVGTEPYRAAARPTRSMVERFGLFVIIVLGEVFVGVITGLSEATLRAANVGAALLGLGIAYGLWWTFFDVAGDRFPSDVGGRRVVWMGAHQMLTMAIAATGAALVTLVEHAEEPRPAPATAWLLGGSVAVALVSMQTMVAALADALLYPREFGRVRGYLLAGAGCALGIAAWRPPAWALALSLFGVLCVIWWASIVQIIQREMDGVRDEGAVT